VKVSKDKVVSIEYTLSNGSGEVLDKSEGRGPLTYLHGRGNLIPGMEEQLEGREATEQMQIELPPDKAYGEHQDQLVQPVPRDRFPDDVEVEVGMQFQAQTEAGPRPVTVVDIGDDEITIDANHPLAGQTLHFDVTVVDVREPTSEELEHGHAHGPSEEPQN